MVELCGLFRIAPSQLTLFSWGLIHALQVLSDLSGVDITGSMVATALCTREIGEGSCRFELSPRPFFRSHVVLPEWLDNTPTSGEYFFAVHLGPRPNGLRLSWSPSGESPEDPPEWTWFPDVLFNLASNLCDTAFLLHPDIIQLTSLASTDEHFFIPEPTIPHECVLYFVDDLRDQNWYSIKDFKIKTNDGRTMTTNNTFKLKFTISTIVKHIPSVSSSLHFYPSSFVDIIHRRLDFQIAIDVIGLLVSCAPIQFRFNEESKINDIAFLSFNIEDDRERIIECQAVGDTLRKIVFVVNNLEILKFAYYDFGILINSQMVCTNTTRYYGTLIYLKLTRYKKGSSSHLNRMNTHQSDGGVGN
ncbi:hypothetical protein Bca52824_026823 [Brassica carinata]|uniref:Replication protein A 70 kDa DNA-binding subunit B/D first OB fold domain-containing protein n=1 Tax=Brassica carinata TaxID=52824 RepID=A0A8X7SK58_BRACI|nr:hypothetical protein Bca52824_026823 [Brassica carinata]